jgi:hypothetical protein
MGTREQAFATKGIGMNSDKQNQESHQTNVNVTLGPKPGPLPGLADMLFPCPLCGAGLPILASKRGKPYCVCDICGLQVFVRGKNGIARLQTMADTGILVVSCKKSASHGINLYNRLKQLELQKNELRSKGGIFFLDQDTHNAIQILDAEIEKVQGELAKIAQEAEGEIKK